MSSLRSATLYARLIFLFAGCTTIVISGCASDVKKDSGGTASATSSTSDLGHEYSLQSDRTALDEVRKDIPEEIKKQNDEVALVMSYIVRDSEEEPNRLRDRFGTALRKRREASDKELSRARETFSKNEKKTRDAFLAKSKEEREEFLKARKRSTDDRKKFFEDQEDRRKAFFADLQEKRKDFEASVTDRRKSVEDSTREKQNAFNQEWRAYQTRYTERKKQSDLKKQMEAKSRDLERAGRPVSPVTSTPATASGLPYPESSFVQGAPTAQGAPAPSASPVIAERPKDPLAEFDQIPKGPGVQLVPGKKGP